MLPWVIPLVSNETRECTCSGIVFSSRVTENVRSMLALSGRDLRSHAVVGDQQDHCLYIDAVFENSMQFPSRTVNGYAKYLAEIN